ncbi:V-type ATP synthase subunit D [Kushneria phosphatilytica]|uniref:V-type ATP synthase subunit D n=1 Tax=Kushneria phosphatilytica TaxID=657387 RepID=A0A1S1NWJ7_9GAMM|nr:V-type ATP synthase subunit D [Kushneria phosphatilytica]OHV10022.1 hypothetical protein BH688_10455 [Kushneria phosphatilytica]QEL11706.1 V-type ATP synthase subunit D [Kushneria phosphatilytica]
MQKPALNKSSLSHLERQRSMYQRYLPALEMKQRLLLTQRKQTGQRLATLRQRINEQQATIGRDLPMMADEDIALTGLVEVEDVEIVQENLVGVSLPALGNVRISRHSCPLLVQPHWVDQAQDQLAAAMQLEVERRVLERRLTLLDDAVRLITQRINLFSRVMIPELERHMKRIDLHLSDQERAAVVRAKLAKQKLARTEARP